MFESRTSLPAPAAAATDFSRFGTLRGDAVNGRKDAALAAAAREFEAVFIGMMLKTARAAMPDSGLLNSSRMDLFQDMFDEQIALSMSERGAFGVAKAIEAQMAGKQPRSQSVAAPPISAAQDVAVHVVERGADEPGKRALPLLTPDQDFLLLDTRMAPARRPGTALETSEQNPFASMAFEPAPRTVLHPRRDAAGVDRQTEFLRLIGPAVSRAAKHLNVPAAGIAAQAILETGWGGHIMLGENGQSSHNLFGVKAGRNWSGPSVAVETREVINGRALAVQARFRAYPDVETAVADYEALLLTPRYQSVRGQASVAGFAGALARAGYATDPDYAEKITRVARQIAPLGPLQIAGTPDAQASMP